MYKNLDSFKFWSQKVLPLVYDESLSYYEVLCKLTNYINDMLSNQSYMNGVIHEYGITIGQITADVEFLTTELEKVKNGDYVSLYLDSITNWIDNNLQEMVAKIVKYVVFGLTTDGYFIAYIPPTWEFMKFDTIIDPTSELYGHLILRW